MTAMFETDDTNAIPLHVISSDGALPVPAPAQAWAKAHDFKGALGDTLTVPDSDGGIAMALVGCGSDDSRRRGRFHLGAAARTLPSGVYRLVTDLPQDRLEEAALGWLLQAYDFDRYRAARRPAAGLICPSGVDGARIEAIAQAEWLTRDLINTPASDMGPTELEEAARSLARSHQAKVEVITGDDLLAANFPMIHAVGRASPRAPRLIDLTWGEAGPRVTLVGKGVCFDTGGLDIKPASSMGLMKKDMGGAATVLGLAQMIMSMALPVRLRVLIPAVENSISGAAFRPQDILTSRKGLTVEVNNTDAEGRLVLADALTLASEERPDLVVSMATLTGAARVAVGPDLSPYFTDDQQIATALDQAGSRVADPVWRLPFHDPYETMIEPGVADLDNAPSGGMAGSITAALFLRRFVDADLRYLHFDIYGWNPADKPGRPKGGVGMGARALFDALPTILSL